MTDGNGPRKICGPFPLQATSIGDMLLFAVVTLAIFVVCLVAVMVGLKLRVRSRRVPRLPTNLGLYLKGVKSRI